jgi:hypothetical protein
LYFLFFMVTELIRASLLLVSSIALLGCGKHEDSRVAVYPVVGKLLVAGKPAPRAEITLHLLTADGKFDTSMPMEKTIRPFAIVENDGVFRPTTYTQGDGAPAGEYAITVRWPSYTIDAGEEIAGPDQLKGQYGDRNKPVQKVSIKPAENQLPTIDLK